MQDHSSATGLRMTWIDDALGSWNQPTVKLLGLPGVSKLDPKRRLDIGVSDRSHDVGSCGHACWAQRRYMLPPMRSCLLAFSALSETDGFQRVLVDCPWPNPTYRSQHCNDIIPGTSDGLYHGSIPSGYAVGSAHRSRVGG